MFRLQRKSNYGTATPAVARTFMQGCDLLNWFRCSEEQKEQTKKILLELQENAVRCTAQRDELVQAYDSAVKEAQETQSLQPHPHRTVVIPGVGDVRGRAENFLQAAKLAIATTGNLTEPFYGKKFGHNYLNFSRWAGETFGRESEFHTVVSSWEPFVKRVTSMRNAVDHPKDSPAGRLVVHDFTLSEEPSQNGVLNHPSFSLSGEPPMPLIESMNEILENIIVLGEAVLVRLFYEFKGPFPVEIASIPADKRDPANVRRLEVRLAQ